LLFPELFGLMAIVTSILVGVALFSDVGIGLSVIRHPRGEEPAFLRTAWTMQVVRGFLLWLALVVIAPAVAAYYGDDRLLWLLPVVGLTCVFQGFTSMSLHLMRRKMMVREGTLLDLGTQLLSALVMVVWAYLSPGILSLVVGSLAGSLAHLIGSHLLTKWEPDRFGWDGDVAQELVGFGGWIFLSTAFTFLASQADRLLLAKLYSFDFVGIYNIGFNLADVPKAVIISLSAKVILPLLSHAFNEKREDVRLKIRRPRLLLLIAAAIGLAVLVGWGDLLVRLLYDRRYHEAAWMLPILAAGAWLVILARSVDSILYAAGKPKLAAVGFAGSFLFLLAGTLAGDWLLGAVGAVVAVAVSPLPHYLAVQAGIRRQGFYLLRQDAAATILFLMLTAAIIGARVLAGSPPALIAELREVIP
jgi:O-antigen/teichoic acid export membrane protein